MTELRLGTVAQMVGGELQGDPESRMEGAAGLADAGPTDLSYLASPKLAALLETTKAGALLLEPSRRGAWRMPVIYVHDPKRAFVLILKHLERFCVPLLPAGLHPTAIVSPHARLGQDVRVGPLAIIEAGAMLGDGCRIGAQSYLGHNVILGKGCLLHPRVTLRERCTLGDRVILHPGVVVGADGYGYLQGDQGHEKIPQIGRVVIEDDVEVGANTTIDRATTGATRIGKGTKIDNLVQIAHNVTIGRHCLVIAQVGIAGSTEVGDGAVLAGQVGVGDHLSIGAGAQVGGGSGVLGNIPKGGVYFGYPARPAKEAMKIQGILSRLPEIYEAYRKARATAPPGRSEA